MSRREFPRAIKVAVVKRAMRAGVVYCESPGCGLPARKWQIDHIRPDGLLGEPVIENAMLICEPCYAIKNPADTSKIARAKRREAAQLGVTKPNKQPIPQRPKPEKAKRDQLDMPARRQMFQDADQPSRSWRE